MCESKGAHFCINFFLHDISVIWEGTINLHVTSHFYQGCAMKLRIIFINLLVLCLI
jgi:hypothetical protein